MGTSQSSDGPGPGVPLVPPWVDEPPSSDDADQPDPDAGEPDQSPSVTPNPLAPPRRFLGARTNLGRFARSGDLGALRRALGHYVGSGYGGARTAARRFGGTAAAADKLHGALAALATGAPATPEVPLDPNLLAGQSAQDVMHAVIEAVRPTDGTQDAEASREAVARALAELLTRHPDANLVDLSEDQRREAVELFVSHDIYRRLALDLGKAIQDNAPTALEALSRLGQVQDYIRATVSSAFRRLRATGHTLTGNRVSGVVQRALREAFFVFEAYST